MFFENSTTHLEHNASANDLTAKYGLNESEWKFIREFDKPLLQSFPKDAKSYEIRQLLIADFKDDFDSKKSVIKNRFPDLHESELFITYLTLRVGLSIPILDSGKTLQRKLEPALMDPRGNCVHYAYRSSFVFDAFNFNARVVTLSTPPYIMGHAVADIYDPDARLAALVDANKKFIFFIRNADASFFETVLAIRNRAQREALLNEMIIVELPADVRYFNPSEGHLAAWRSGKGPSTVLDQVRKRMVKNRIRNTREAFLDGYERLFTQRTRDDKNWWLRVHDMSMWANGVTTGIEGQKVVDNSRIMEIINQIRSEKQPN